MLTLGDKQPTIRVDRASATGITTAAFSGCGSEDPPPGIRVDRRFPHPGKAGRSVSDSQEWIYELTTQISCVRRASFQPGLARKSAGTFHGRARFTPSLHPVTKVFYLDRCAV